MADLEVGHYKYTFSNALPATMDPAKPHTLAAMGSRNTTDIVGKQYYAVPQYKDFVPSTNAAAVTFNAMTVARCNQCHDPLALHGGNYRDIKTCVLCHNPNNMTGTNDGSGGEPGEPRVQYDGEIFFHALHMGKNAEVVPNITYPQDIRYCTTCHDPAAAGGASWYTYPSIAACGSCHDDVNFTTGANHVAGPATDGSCASCHQPPDEKEYGPGIKTAHVVPVKSSQLKGYTAQITSVTNAGPGKKITVVFKLRNGDGSFVDPGVYKVSANGSISIKLGGPTSDYTNPGMAAAGQPFSESVQTAAYDPTTGLATYTFTNAIPAAAKGTYVVSIETRRTIALNPAPTKGPASVSEGAPNQPVLFRGHGHDGHSAPDGRPASKCNVCHASLNVLFSHGNQRIAIEQCVICHNPNASDIGRRPTDHSQDPGESIEFARMIHRIHTGEELTQDYTVYGFGGSTSTSTRSRIPATAGTASRATLPPRRTRSRSDRERPSSRCATTSRRSARPRRPARAATTAATSLAHAYLNTAFFPGSPTEPAEACGTCHGAGDTSTSIRSTRVNRVRPVKHLSLGAFAATALAVLTAGPVVAQAPAKPAAAKVEAGPACADCHDEAKIFATNPHSRGYLAAHPGAGENAVCETCHGDGTKHMEAEGDKTLIKTLHGRTGTDTCLTCHKQSAERASFWNGVHASSEAVNCLSCHSIHKSGFGQKSLLKSDPNTLCATCHGGRQGLVHVRAECAPSQGRRHVVRELPRSPRAAGKPRRAHDPGGRARLRLLPRREARAVRLPSRHRRRRRLHVVPPSARVSVPAPADEGHDREPVSRVPLPALDGHAGLAAAFLPRPLAAALPELHDVPHGRPRFAARPAAPEVRTGRCEESSAPPSSRPPSRRRSPRALPAPRRFRSTSRSATASSP